MKNRRAIHPMSRQQRRGRFGCVRWRSPSTIWNRHPTPPAAQPSKGRRDPSETIPTYSSGPANGFDRRAGRSAPASLATRFPRYRQPIIQRPPIPLHGQSQQVHEGADGLDRVEDCRRRGPADVGKALTELASRRTVPDLSQVVPVLLCTTVRKSTVGIRSPVSRLVFDGGTPMTWQMPLSPSQEGQCGRHTPCVSWRDAR